MKKKILAIVPARGGSKGIKNKNLKKINGKSLIRITTEVIKKVKIIDTAIISTDSKKIADEAVKSGLFFIKKRSKHLSGDFVGDMPVLKEALNHAEIKFKCKFDIILMMQVTSVLRNPKDLYKGIKYFKENNLDSLWSVSEIDLKYHPLKQLYIKDNYLKLYNSKGNKIIARQQLCKTFIRNGCFYIYKRKCIINKDKIPLKTGAFKIKSSQISIDTLTDLRKATQYFNTKK